MIYLYLFWEFFKTGLFSIGGGLATVPFLISIAERHPDWYTVEELTNMIAVSESTPGPIGINMATYCGFKTGGVPGGVIATLSLVLPSIMIIMIIAGFLSKFNDSRLVKNAFFALRPAVVGLVAVSVLTVARPLFLDLSASGWLAVIDWKKLALFGLLLFGVLKWKKHPILYIGIGAVAGILLRF